MWKRISAGMFDGILLGVVAVLCAWLLSMALGFDGHYNELEQAYARAGEQYGVNLNMSLEEYESMTAEELARAEEAYASLSQDEKAVYAYNMVIQLTLLIASFGILLAYMILEFTVPMVLGNGQTLGKKMFGLGVMSSEGVRIGGVHLFIRTVLGKYAVETMVPVLVVMMIYFGMVGLAGTMVLGGLLLAELIALAVTHTNSALHDLLAGTVCVNVGTQMIFDSREEMLEFKKKEHAERAARQSY